MLINLLTNQIKRTVAEGRYAHAVALCRVLRRVTPNSLMGYCEACVAYRHMGEWDKADAVVEEGLAKLGEIRELLIAYGDTAMDRQRWEEALERWERQRHAFPQEERGWVRAVEALLQLERMQEVRQLLAEATEPLGEREGIAKARLDIESRLKALLGSAQSALKEKRWEEAAQRYGRLREQDPDNWRGYGEACVAYRHMGEWERADTVVEEGLAKLGEIRELLIAYGDTAMDRQRWEEGLVRWERMRHVCPNDRYSYQRAIIAARKVDGVLPRIRAFESYRDQFGLDEPDPLSLRLLEAISYKMKKARRICFIQGSGFLGHGKYLFLYLNKHRADFGIEVFWVTDHILDYELLLSKDLPVLYFDLSPKAIDFLLETDVAVYETHDAIPLAAGLRQASLSGAIKAQLWHGIPAKLVGYGDFLSWDDVNGYLRYAYDACGYNHIITESEHVGDSYQIAFPCSQLHSLGGCRTDVLLGAPLFDEEELWLGGKPTLIPVGDKKLILYAPTYRERSQDLELFLTSLNDLVDCIEKLEGFVLVIKPHPAFLSESGIDFKGIIEATENTVILGANEDIYPWAARADYLVTDYSSIYYDFLLTKKPIVFLRPDVDLYDGTRTRMVYAFEADIKPGPVVTTAAEIPNALAESKNEKWRSNRVALAEKFHTLPHDGMATKRVADFIVSLLRV